MKAKLFSVQCLTNMHVGTGDYSVSIIDNEVAKDVNDASPYINGSGVKGALREYFERLADAEFKGDKKGELIQNIFGGDRIEIAEVDNSEENEETNNNNNNKTQASEGKLKFLAAYLLARPMRTSKGEKPYYLITTKELVEKYNHLLENVVRKTDKITIEDKENSDIKVENKAIIGKLNKMPNLVNLDEIYLLEQSDFDDVELPIIARNEVRKEKENGEMTRGNLWYEEIVPYNSVFYFYVLANDSDGKLLEKFAEKVESKVVQFGGNASVGYGYTMVKEIQGGHRQ